MAFVNRSPRNLDKFPKHYSCKDQESQESDQEQYANPCLQKKYPQKGLAFPKYRDVQSNQTSVQKNLKESKTFLHLEKEVSVLRVPKQKEKMQYFFKSKCNREEFQDIKNTIGESNQNTKMKRQQKKPTFSVKSFTINKESKTINLLDAIKKVKKVEKTPSIPGKMEKFGYVTKEKQNGFKYPEKVSRPRFEGTNGDTPGPGQYQYDLRPKIKGCINYSVEKNSSQDYTLTQAQTNGFFALISDQEALSIHNEQIREWVKKKPKLNKVSQVFHRKAELRTRQKSEYSDSDSGVTVYDDDTTPGPGYYHYQKSPPKQFRSKKDKFKKIFFNKSQRFQIEKESEQDSLDFLNSEQIGKNKKFYISKLKRDLNLANNNDSVSPGYYETRQNMEHDVISKVLKNSPNLYNNGIPRIPNYIKEDTPGPGCYNPYIPNFKIESIPPEYLEQYRNSLKKSTINNLLTNQIQLLKNKPKKIINSRIHERKDEVIEEENFAPFGSTSPKSLQNRFSSVPHCYYPQKISPLLNKKEQNKSPFNSSLQKGKPKKEEYSAGVGLYDLEGIQSWDTKSYNILFN